MMTMEKKQETPELPPEACISEESAHGVSQLLVTVLRGGTSRTRGTHFGEKVCISQESAHGVANPEKCTYPRNSIFAESVHGVW